MRHEDARASCDVAVALATMERLMRTPLLLILTLALFALPAAFAAMITFERLQYRTIDHYQALAVTVGSYGTRTMPTRGELQVQRRDDRNDGDPDIAWITAATRFALA